MIIQEVDGELWLFRQTDHALLSGAFATAWGNDVVPPLRRREELLIAAARHDDGWSEWELAPKLRDDGRPVDFIRIPVSDHAPLYKRGTDLVEAEDSYAGLVVSLHFDRLYTRPFHPGMDPRIEHLKGEDRELARRHVEGERRRQERLTSAIGGDTEADAEEAWCLLQVWDRMSLLVCMNRIAAGLEQTFRPIADGIEITARATADGVLAFEPYPFDRAEAEFDVTYVRLPAATWTDEASFRRDFRAAPHETLRFTCVGR